MAVDVVVVLVVTLVGVKDASTRRALEVLQMVLVAQCCDVRSTQGTVTLHADKVKLLEVVVLTKWDLKGETLRVSDFVREELGRALFSTLVACEAVNMVCATQSTHKLAIDHETTPVTRLAAFFGGIPHKPWWLSKLQLAQQLRQLRGVV